MAIYADDIGVWRNKMRLQVECRHTEINKPKQTLWCGVRAGQSVETGPGRSHHFGNDTRQLFKVIGLAMEEATGCRKTEFSATRLNCVHHPK